MSSSNFSIDIEDIKAIATKACDVGSSIEVIDHHLEPYSNTKVGFLGNHCRLEITIKQYTSKDEFETKKLSCFVKAVPEVSKTQTSFIQQQQVFKQEAAFFNSVMPDFVEAMSAADIEQWGPKCYMANENFVVLEDVRTRGYAMSKSRYIEGDNLKSAARALARLHASSLIVEKRLGKPLNEVYPDACIEHVFNEHMWLHTDRFVESLIKDVAKNNGRDAKGLEKGIDLVFEYMNRGKGKNPVICHGDVWTNNIMLDDSKPPKCILVDYQMTKYAPRTADLGQLIHLSCTSDVRKRQEKETVEAYWKELCEVLQKSDPDIEKPTLEDMMSEYEEHKIISRLLAIVYFPILLLSPQVHAEYKDKPEKLYANFIIRRNNDHVLELMEKEEEYNNRITEAIMDFLESCEKLE